MGVTVPGTGSQWIPVPGCCGCSAMFPTIDVLRIQRKRPPLFSSDPYSLYKENAVKASLYENKQGLPGPSMIYDKPPQHPRTPNRNNMPHPINIKFIENNVRFLNKPIAFVSTASTKYKQSEWWPTEQSSVSLHKPPYDLMTTQRTDFYEQPYCGRQTRHGNNPSSPPPQGIVPLASPKGQDRLPKLFQEQISFTHQYNSRVTPNEPIRGKRHGCFLLREINNSAPHGYLRSGVRGEKPGITRGNPCKHGENMQTQQKQGVYRNPTQDTRAMSQ
ncbi:uncharacterized protein C2orf73 homolog [Pseudophryne corroboree]|uniref:uncharacterized protein C2orf73 homolog n=1 Tax=Pseudophryne corroboree TaxID=495146 RepID=UPI0030821C43